LNSEHALRYAHALKSSATAVWKVLWQNSKPQKIYPNTTSVVLGHNLSSPELF